MKHRLAIFDFDGTLASSLEGIHASMKETLPVFGFPAPALDAVRATVGLTLEESVRILTNKKTSDAHIAEIVKVYREVHDVRGGATIRLYDGAARLLEALPTFGVKSALISNKGKKALEETLSRLRIWAFFDLTLSAEDVKFNKPKPELYKHHIAPQFPGISAGESLVVGDSEVDLRFAKAAGLASCWARYGYGEPDRCRALRPDFEIGEINELRVILRRSADR